MYAQSTVEYIKQWRESRNTKRQINVSNPVGGQLEVWVGCVAPAVVRPFQGGNMGFIGLSVLNYLWVHVNTVGSHLSNGIGLV